MKSLKFLVVDDSIITVGKITAMLAEMGHQVVCTAGTGAEALKAYKECMPDIVTMDITMPDMDGVQATRLIVEEFPDASIIMVTSHGQEKMVLAAIDAGAVGYVLKPVRIEKLQSSVAQVIKKRHF